MATKKDFYEVLGINKSASDDEIKKAYRKMAKKYHPDANPGNQEAEKNFKEINEAYSVLSEPQKKAAYDQYGHAAFEQGGGGGGFYGGADVNINDIFESFFGDNFGDIFGGGGRHRQGPMRGADIHTNMRIKFEEAVFGVEKEVQIQANEICDVCSGSGAKPGTVAESCRHCGGTGQERIQKQTMFGAMTSVRTCSICRGEGKIIRDPCNTCRGAGKVKKIKKLQINVPKGIDNGQTIRIGGKGEPGERNGQYGDLLITIYVKSHELFTRQGYNLYLEVPITFVQAALGVEMTIPTLYGEEKQVIKAGTQTGSKITLRGKGVPSIKNNKIIGDLIVTLNVTVPTTLNERQKQLLKEFADEMGNDYKEDNKKGFWEKVKEMKDKLNI